MQKIKEYNWEEKIRRLELLMRLKSFPVGFKMLEKKEQLEEIKFLRRFEHNMTLCQLINLVRNFDWTVGADLDDFMSPMCPSIIGMADLPEIYKDGTFRSIVWVRRREDGKKYEESVQRIPTGKYQAVVMAPLVYNPFEPDIVLIYANPAQMMLLINSLQFDNYEVMQFFCVGESSCSDAIARCYLTQKPSLTIPCYGERRYGHAQDDELVMAIPAGMMEKVLVGMETLYKRGIRYPISFAGAEQDLEAAFPLTYTGIDDIEAIRGKDNRLLLGLTGGIASGKTAVSNMLEDMGAHTIDFDIISREVVEPEKPAWKDIVDFFGKQIISDDGQLERKMLSGIVFNDLEKRKKLESFIHPRIHEEFVIQINSIVEKDPNAIIQVVIPLLIEINLQYMFHKLGVVYISYEEQLKRLIKREGISEKEACSMLNAQLPIDEKTEYADYIINNENSLEETKKQVEELWQTLKEIQKTKNY